MNKYEISPLSSNKTILQVVKGIEKYLIDNPQYKVYFINTNYVEGTLIYSLSNVSSRGDTLTEDDIVVFKNSYYAVIESVGETTITIHEGISSKGAKGDTGATGQDGQDGEDGVGIASISSSQVDSQVTLTFTLTDGTTQTITFTASGGGGASVEDITNTLTFDSTIPNTSKVSKYGNVVHISLMLGDFQNPFNTFDSGVPKSIITGLPIPKNKGAYSTMLSQLGGQDTNSLLFALTPPQNAGSEQYMVYAIIDTNGNFKILTEKVNIAFWLDEITYICE